MGTPSGIGYVAVLAMLVPSLLLLIIGIILHRKGERDTAKILWCVGAVILSPLLMALMLFLFSQIG